jgi:hypothetical protein
MDAFKKDLGAYDQATDTYVVPATWLSTGTGTPQAGLALGCLIAGAVGRRIGRVKSFYLAAAISIVGVLIQATTMQSYWQLMAGRVVNSVSMGIICKSVACVNVTSIRGWNDILTRTGQRRSSISIRVCASENQRCLDQHLPVLAPGRRHHGRDLQLGHTAMDKPLGVATYHCAPAHHPNPNGRRRCILAGVP